MQTQIPEKIVSVVNDCDSENDLPKEPAAECVDMQSVTTSASSKLLGKRFKPQEFSQESLYLDIEVPNKKAKSDKTTERLIRQEVEKMKTQLLKELNSQKSPCINLQNIINSTKDLIGGITQNLEDIEHHLQSINQV